MKSEEIRRKAMALAIGMAMIALILTIFLSIPVLAAANENKTTIYKNPISEYTQAAFPSYPPPIQEAFRHTELKKYPKSHEEFKKLMEERRGQRSWSHEEFKKLMEERRGPRSWENMKEGKEIRGTYLDITGNFETLWEESDDVDFTHALIAGDLDGDGLDDVLVIQHKFDEETNTEMGIITAKRGINGTDLWNDEVAISNGYCWIDGYPAGDLDGDGLDDVLVNIHTYDDTTRTETGQVIAKRGYDGERLWDESVSASNGYCEIWAMPAGDLDGDGLDDVLVNIHAYDDTTRTATGQVIAKRGYDGEHLWDESVKVSNGHCDIWAMPDGDLDGDDLDDVLVNIRTYDDTTDTATGQVIAKRGINGEHLWEESVKASNGFCWIDGYPAGDLDGDDLDDVLVNIHTYDYTTDTATGQVIAKRGYDGNLLWEATSDDYIWIAMAYPELYDYGYDPELYDYGYGNISEWGYDLNGDGINDIVLGNSNTIHAVTYAAAAPSPKISVSTDKIEYCPCDTMQIDVDISNPTENPVIFKWYLGVPTNGLWMQIWKIKLPAGFEGTIEVELHVGQWSKTPFGGVWYVDLQEPTTGKELAADCACWSYCPTGGEKVTRMPMSKPTSFKDIVKEIRKETRKEIEGIA